MESTERIGFAQDFFRFAHLVGGPISFGIKFDLPDPPEVWTFGGHSFLAAEYKLSEEAYQLCGTLLERLAYRLLAMELNSALEKKFGAWRSRSCHSDSLVRNASIVIWIIRNSVAHEIFEPIWKIDDPALQNKIFVIDGILSFDTTGLNGKLIRRLDFGGPIALFRLSEKLLDIFRTNGLDPP